MNAIKLITKPIVEEHNGIMVVRDDLFPGGSKARFIPALFEGVKELVYASPACGGAQLALATVAAKLKKKATIVVAKRQQMHPRTRQAKELGANIVQVSPGYLTVVQKRSREYVLGNPGARLLPFGLNVPEAVAILAACAQETKLKPDEVWCAGGSGVLARALAFAFPKANRYVVQVGHALSWTDVGNATIIPYPAKFEQLARGTAPFSSDGNYDRKAWEVCRAHHGAGLVLFWNVAGAAE